MSNIPIIYSGGQPYYNKYTIVNTGQTTTTINYRRASDYKWVYQEPILPNQRKNIWAVPETLNFANYFHSDIQIENEISFLRTEDNGCWWPNIPYPVPMSIYVSSRSTNPPTIKVEYRSGIMYPIFDPTLLDCSWTYLNTLTPSVCPNYLYFGSVNMTAQGFYLQLKVTLSTNDDVRVNYYMSTITQESCQLSDELQPCNPNSQAFISSGCSGGLAWILSDNSASTPLRWEISLPESDIMYTECALDFDTLFVCDTDKIILIATNFKGFIPWQCGTTYFTSEADALANTNWGNSFFYSQEITYETYDNGTFWIVAKSCTGQILAKSVTTNCGPLPSPTASVTPTNTSTQTQTPTPSITATQTQTPTNTQTPTPSITATQTPTNTSTQTPTNTSTQTPTPSVTAEPTPTPTPNWVYYNVTQYLNCVQNSAPGAYQLRAPSTFAGPWFFTGDGYQYQFDTNQTPPYSYILEATSDNNVCI